MTHEEATIKTLEAIIHIISDEYYNDETEGAIHTAIRSIKAWDAIRQEISTIVDAIDYNQAFAEGMKEALAIIDRHLQEVEHGRID